MALLVAAALLKFVYPAAFDAVGEKIGETVNYKAALTVLGEGISGEKKFTEALGEAFTDAFTTGGSQSADQAASNETSGGQDTAAKASGGDEQAPASPSAASGGNAAADSAASESAAASPSGASSKTAANENAVSNAVVQAFLQSQEEYSDYAIPAGVTYEMPNITLDYTKPVLGVVSSTFGYRHDPTDSDSSDKPVKFHYGTDIAAKEGTEIDAFADGKVIAVGDSATLGKYVVISHGGSVETEYGHCRNVYVSDGQAVVKGGKIAAVGKTGNATDACLHFELKVSGVNVNPQYYINWA